MAASIDRAGPRAPGNPTDAAKSEAKKPTFDHSWSRQFPNWLAEQNVSLAFTTYQANMIFLVGLRDDGRASFFRRAIPRCMACMPTAMRCT
jgi:hypothetical protein